LWVTAGGNDRDDKPIPASLHRAHILVFPAYIAQCLAKGRNASREIPFLDKSAIPDSLKQFVLFEESAWVLREHDKNVKNLTRDGDRLTIADESSVRGIDLEPVEEIPDITERNPFFTVVCAGHDSFSERIPKIRRTKPQGVE